mmetsp:Transcript_42536/g.100082  ORF Transcript_42536/g.100082 Transcript_42536/m.100082 type:complete len:291 (-) Transcript_42536:612-1484(-)
MATSAAAMCSCEAMRFVVKRAPMPVGVSTARTLGRRRMSCSKPISLRSSKTSSPPPNRPDVPVGTATINLEIRRSRTTMAISANASSSSSEAVSAMHTATSISWKRRGGSSVKSPNSHATVENRSLSGTSGTASGKCSINTDTISSTSPSCRASKLPNRAVPVKHTTRISPSRTVEAKRLADSATCCTDLQLSSAVCACAMALSALRFAAATCCAAVSRCSDEITLEPVAWNIEESMVKAPSAASAETRAVSAATDASSASVIACSTHDCTSDNSDASETRCSASAARSA